MRLIVHHIEQGFQIQVNNMKKFGLSLCGSLKHKFRCKSLDVIKLNNSNFFSFRRLLLLLGKYYCLKSGMVWLMLPLCESGHFLLMLSFCSVVI